MPRSAALSVLLMLVLASGADAQTVSSTTGAIDGRVTDASNAVLPGVTVTLTGGPGGSLDWLAFAPVGAANNSYAQFTDVGAGVPTRTWTITTPATPGVYEFRLFKQGTFTRLATSP